MLDVRRTELVGELHQISQKKLKRLAAQRDLLETDQIQLSQSVNTAKESLQANGMRGAMEIKTTIEKQVKKLITGLKKDAIKLSARADIVLSPSIDISSVCTNFGKLRETDRDPAQFFVDAKVQESLLVGERATATVKIVDDTSDPCDETVEFKVVSDLTNAVVKTNAKRMEQGTYLIKYTPTLQGSHQLHVKIKQQHIRGSPLPVSVKLPRDRLGSPVFSIDNLKNPWGVAVNQKGEIFVSENKGHCISVFSAAGKKLRSFGSRGSGEGQLRRPRGITFDRHGSILVTEYKNHRIQKFTAEGTFLAAVDSTTPSLKFCHPKAIAFNNYNDKFFVLDKLSRVQVLNCDLSYCKTF
jgi:tripartite motif-containing protein 2/3/tripartite motif-containing protein 71